MDCQQQPLRGEGLTYDRNGNILTLQRTGNGALVDNLTYTYTGNQLTTLQEAVRTATAADVYAPGSTPNGTYEYDANGNMTKDNRKGLEFTYNSLNLLSQVKENGTVKATYQYTANGTKLSVRGNGNSGYDYDGSFVYVTTNNTPALEAAHFPEGQLKANGVSYALTDHLGSTRAMVDANGNVLQQRDYYPFGSQHVNASYTDNDNRYTFSGKELQDLLDLNMYDFGARMLDASLGRWYTPDTMADKYVSFSPYSDKGNYSVNARELDGRLFIFVNGFYPTEYFANRFTDVNSRIFPKQGYIPDRSFQTADFYGWEGIDKLYMNTYNDSNARYVNGSFMIGSQASSRYNEGYSKGLKLISKISSGEIVLGKDETIKIVGYSMGSAYAAGMAAAIMQSPQYSHFLQFVDYIAPYQPTDFKHPSNVLGRQFAFSNDSFDTQRAIRNITLKRVENLDDSGGLEAHALGSDLKDFLERCFNSGIPIYISE